MEQSLPAPDAPARPAPTRRQILIAALIGFGVAMAIAGELMFGAFGPLVGGFVAGARVRARGRVVMAIGLIMGSLLAIVAFVVSRLILILMPFPGNMWLRALMVAGGVFAYATVCSTIGAAIAGRRAS